MKLKTKFAAIVFIMALVIPMAIVALPTAVAAEPSGTKSYPFLGAVPNPVGVGQEVLLHVGALTALQTAEDGWEGLTVEITKPDNTTTSLNAPKTDSTGGTGLVLIPDLVGTYYIYTSFPAQWYYYTGIDWSGNTVVSETYYLAAESAVLELVVQADPIEYYPSAPLPTEYWSRPIDAQLREWYTISGSWLMTPPNLYAPDNAAPETPHILWTMPIGETMGGLIGGSEYFEDSYGIGDAYEGKWIGSIIISGVLYYHKQEAGAPNQEIVAVDLHTGEVLWEKSLMGQRMSFGQIINWECLQYYGGFSYIWVQTGGGGYGAPVTPTVWSAFDALTGDWRFNMTNIPSGTNYLGPSGEILKYSISNGRLLQWNQSYVVTAGKSGMSASWGSQVLGQTYDVNTRPNRGYDLNVSAANGGTLPGSILTVFPGDKVIGGSESQTEVRLWALDLRKGSEGNLLFNKTWKAPSEWVEGNVTVSGFQAGWAAFSEDTAILFAKELVKYYAFDLTTGNFKWSTEPQNYLDAWDDALTVSFGPNTVIAYDKLYTASISGIAHAYDLETGELVWNYSVVDNYSEFQFTNNWWMRIMFVSDGKIYYGHLEHSPVNPRPRGGPFLCLNATSGEEIFRADGLFRQSRWGGRAIMGDSIIATQDTYNQQVYAIGKGPSKTTVTAPDMGVPLGTSVIVRGTVTDVSPGTTDPAVTLRFPNGVPAVSDASQTSMMQYVYKQFAQPMDLEGVVVQLSVIDSNGNYRIIDTTTSDASGAYSFQWTPDISGKYTVIATFAGSGAYYSSSAQTAIGVDEVPTTPQPTESPPSISEQYFIPAIAGLFAFIAVIGVVIILVVRKRP